MRKKNLSFLAMVLGDVKWRKMRAIRLNGWKNGHGSDLFATMYGRGADLVPLEELLYPEVVRVARKHVGGE